LNAGVKGKPDFDWNLDYPQIIAWEGKWTLSKVASREQLIG
jgi:hypothetical protein